jgi:xylulokinase
MLLLGIDVGTSSIKVSVVDGQTQKCVASAYYPETEAEIISHKSGWQNNHPKPGGNILNKLFSMPIQVTLIDPKDIAAMASLIKCMDWLLLIKIKVLYVIQLYGVIVAL